MPDIHKLALVGFDKNGNAYELAVQKEDDKYFQTVVSTVVQTFNLTAVPISFIKEKKNN